MNAKKRLCLICAVVLSLILCGCWGDPSEPTEETTEFTLPTLNETQTPDSILRSAADLTKGLDAFFVDYVRILGQERFALSGQAEIKDDHCTAQTLCGSFTEEGTMEAPVYRYYENATCFEKKEEQVQQLSSESPYTLLQIFEDIPPIPKGLVDRFSGRSLHAIPGEDGSMRFQLSNLTPTEFEAITGFPCEEGENSVSLSVDSEGYLSKIAFTAPELQITLTIRQATEDEPLTKPDWIS